MPKHKIYRVLRVFVGANHRTLSNRKGSLPWRVRTYFSDIAMGIQTGQFNFFGVMVCSFIECVTFLFESPWDVCTSENNFYIPFDTKKWVIIISLGGYLSQFEWK